jgi:hypothetical protein
VRAGSGLLGLLGGIALAGGVAFPADALPGAPRLGIEPFGGVLALDPALDDYRWDAGPRPVGGITLRADAARLGGGARVWGTGTTQRAALLDESVALDVGLLAFDGFVEARLASIAGFDLGAAGRLGALRISWSPDRLAIDAGGGSPVSVAFDPIVETTWGAGLGVRRGIPGGFELSVGAERTWFRLDTAHRRGDEIVTERTTFANWLATVAVTRRLLPL